METLNSPKSPPIAALARRDPPSNKFYRSLSTKEPSFSDLNFTPQRLISPSVAASPQLSPPRSPLQYPPVSPFPGADSDHALRLSLRCTVPGPVLSIAASVAGFIYTGSRGNVVRVWKLPEFRECGELKTKAVMVVALEASNDRVYAAYADCKIRVWRRTRDGVGAVKHVRLATIPKTGNCVRSYIAGKDKMMKHLGPISSVAINVSEDILYSASLDKTLKVWRISDHKCVETIQAHTDPINAAVVADDGILYTASDDATVKVWRRNFYNHDRLHSLTLTLPAKNSPVKALALSTDGAVLYGGCTDGYIYFWHRGWFSGQLQYGGALQGHTHAVMCLASVAAFVVSGSADCTSRVWARNQDGAHVCVALLQGHRGPVRCVTAFLGCMLEENIEDGVTVCTGGSDGFLKVWKVRPSGAGSAMNQGCEYFVL